MSQRFGQHADKVAPAFLADGGEMGERTRAFDWSISPLGPVENWPQNLRSALSICLNSNFPIAIYWGHDLLLLYNDEWSPILGEKHPWALGRPACEAWPEIWHIIEPLFRRVFTTGEAVRCRDQLLPMHRHGFTEECYFDYTFSPIRGESGKVEGVFNAVLETTTRVIGERRLRTLREFATWETGVARSAEETCQTAASIIGENQHDLPFVILYLLDGHGQRAIRAGLTGLEHDNPACPTAVDLTADSPWPFGQVVESGKAVEVHDLPARLGTLPGGAWPESPQRAVILPMGKPGQTQLAGFVVAGVSPRLALNDEYRGFLDLLAGHVATAIASARAFEEERRRVEALAELDRAKTAFFSNVSHEFRTPLTLMLGPVAELLARSHENLSPTINAELEVVNRNGLRLLRLVNNLLDFSRIEAGRIQALYQPTDLAAFTADLASVFRSACERAGLRLVVDCPPLGEPIFVDREMWEKIVLNLLSNAFKFTFDGDIAVSLRQVGTIAELRVRDTGNGIPAEEMPRLFQRFHRIENGRGRTHEGSGIGLALVQELVKLHGGSVTAESELGRGTTFIVAVPLGSQHLPADQIGGRETLAPTATGAVPYVEEALRWLPDHSQGLPPELPTYHKSLTLPNARTETDDNDERPRVLVADDNADMRQYVVRLLAQRYRVNAVPDGEAALAAAKAEPPDLILTDVMMPRLDGFGLLRALRADPRTSSVPVIMLSARAGEESRVDGMENGADDYLVKPFTAKELVARVTAHLQLFRLRREASESLRQSGERLRMALTAARMVTWDWKLAEDEFTLSENASEVFGLPPGFKLEHSEQRFALLHPDDVDRQRATVMKAVEECGSYLSHFRMIRPQNGAVIWLEERGQAVRDDSGKAERFVGVVMDITERMQAEERLREADRRKDEFLAILAHELRNPLAPIRNGLQIVKLAGHNQEMVEEARTVMERQVNQMVCLIDDLFDISRISRGKVELRKERVPLATAVQQAIETSRPAIEQAGHELTVHFPNESVIVDADLTRLSQVFTNLLNNAAKYTPPGGHIWLTVDRQGGEAVVSVKDTGVGIPEPMLPRVFEMFTQVDRSLERTQGGLGIGLSLVHGLVEMHGGKVKAHSDGKGMGSEFVVRLPVAPSGGGQERPTLRKESHRAVRRRILVVDDNMDSGSSLALMLKIMGQETQTAADGLEALDVGAAFQPDLILLDIGMPRLNGYEACRRIREQPWGKKIVLVALTGWGQENYKRHSEEVGFNCHLTKPVDLEALEKLLVDLQVHTT